MAYLARAGLARAALSIEGNSYPALARAARGVLPVPLSGGGSQ